MKITNLNPQRLDKEEEKKIIRSLQALKFGLLEVGSVAYWEAEGDKEEFNLLKDGQL